MKTYFVTTSTGSNALNLFSTNKSNYSTTSLEEARQTFEAEVAAVHGKLKTAAQLDYVPSEHEIMNDSVVVTLSAVDDDAEDMAGDCVIIEESDYFFGLQL